MSLKKSIQPPMRRLRAKGVQDRGGLEPKIAVAFRRPTFEVIAEQAHGKRVSFASRVRELVEIGLAHDC